MKLVKNYMNKRVAYLTPSNTIFDAAKVFRRRKISGAPVVANARSKKVVGVVSETDLVNFMGTEICPNILFGDFTYTSLTMTIISLLELTKRKVGYKKQINKMKKIKIRNVMSKRVASVNPEATVYDAAAKMDARDVNRLPVVDDKGKLVGIIARADLVKALID